MKFAPLFLHFYHGAAVSAICKKNVADFLHEGLYLWIATAPGFGKIFPKRALDYRGRIEHPARSAPPPLRERLLINGLDQVHGQSIGLTARAELL